MNRIAEIQSKFNLICDQNASIFGFAFDDPSALNIMRGDGFPYLLLKLPIESSIPDYKQNWELWEIEFFLFEPRHQEEPKTLAEQHDALRVIAEDVIDELIFYPNVYQLGSGVTFEYGHDADNNNSVVVRTKFTLRLFNCRANTATGEVVTVTDNDNAIVGTVAARTTLQVIAKDLSNVEIDCTYTLSNGILTLSGINVATTVIKMIIINNVNTTAQDNELIGAYTIANLCIFGNGTEQISIDNISNYNSTTGTITFVESLGGVTIRVILIA